MLPSRALAVVLVLSFAAPPLASGQSAEAVRALEKYRESRPTDDDLAMYRLDWATPYREARERAVNERRPLLALLIHARYGECYTGHA